jgi:hypothetical protein
MFDHPVKLLIKLCSGENLAISTKKSIWEKRELIDRKKLLLEERKF